MREAMNRSLLGVKLWKEIPQICNRRCCVYTLLLGDFSGNLPAMFLNFIFRLIWIKELDNDRLHARFIV